MPAVLPLLVVAGLAAAVADRMQAVPPPDLTRYAGRWFEVARYPNRFQRDCVADTTAEYRLRPDGRVTVTNRCRQADGTLKEAVGMARWRDQPPRYATLEVRFAPAWLSFLPWVWGDYWILALPEDYRYAVVGEPSRRFLWILSRTPAMSADDYDAARRAAADQGYDVARLQRTQHGPAQ